MPNHVTTRCIITGPASEIERFRSQMITVDGDERQFDFDKIIPMPACLREVVSGSQSEEGAALIMARASKKHSFGLGADDLGLGLRRIEHIRADVGMPREHLYEVATAYLAKHPETEAQGMALLRAVVETGYESWHPWSIDKWGTKWNAYSFGDEAGGDGEYRFRFETAWSFPVPVFEALVAEFPQLDFHCLTFDEGSNFAGKGHFAPNSPDPFKFVDPTDELFERVYGRPVQCEDQDEATANG